MGVSESHLPLFGRGRPKAQNVEIEMDPMIISGRSTESESWRCCSFPSFYEPLNNQPSNGPSPQRHCHTSGNPSSSSSPSRHIRASHKPCRCSDTPRGDTPTVDSPSHPITSPQVEIRSNIDLYRAVRQSQLRIHRRKDLTNLNRRFKHKLCKKSAASSICDTPEPTEEVSVFEEKEEKLAQVEDLIDEQIRSLKENTPRMKYSSIGGVSELESPAMLSPLNNTIAFPSPITVNVQGVSIPRLELSNLSARFTSLRMNTTVLNAAMQSQVKTVLHQTDGQLELLNVLQQKEERINLLCRENEVLKEKLSQRKISRISSRGSLHNSLPKYATACGRDSGLLLSTGDTDWETESSTESEIFQPQPKSPTGGHLGKVK